MAFNLLLSKSPSPEVVGRVAAASAAHYSGEEHMNRIMKVVTGVFAASLVWTPVSAQTSTGGAAAVAGAPASTQPETAPPAKNWTFTTGVDFPTAYVFRGIVQETTGFIAQPPIDLGVTLPHGVSFNVGNWDSLHSGPTGKYYESDYYGAVTFTAGRLKPGLLFTSYTSPNDRFKTVKELAGVLAFDDSKSKVPFSPKAILAFEVGEFGADGGANKGTYLELGVKPTVKAAPKLTIGIPLKLGIGLKDYYEGYSNHFGYFDGGVQASVPVISGKGGALEVHGGVDIIRLGGDLKLLNGGDAVKPVGLLGFTYTY